MPPTTGKLRKFENFFSVRRYGPFIDFPEPEKSQKRGFFGFFASDAFLWQKLKNLEWPKVASCPCGHFKLKIEAFEVILCLTRSDED